MSEDDLCHTRGLRQPLQSLRILSFKHVSKAHVYSHENFGMIIGLMQADIRELRVRNEA